MYFDFPIYLIKNIVDSVTEKLLIFTRFNGLVKYWLTFNEINILLHAPFMGAGIVFEEGENKNQVLYTAAHNELVASTRVIKIANEIDPENKIGCMLAAGKYEKSKDIYAKVKNSNYRISIWWV